MRTVRPATLRTVLTRQFVRHFLEMAAAMIVGMVLLGPLWALAFADLGWSELLAHPIGAALAMATSMTIGMSGWMIYRRHRWVSVAEMAAAMYLPFVVLFVPFWAGVLSGDGMLVAGHVLMVPAMLIAMLHRPDEYTRHLRRPARRRRAEPAGAKLHG